MVIVNSDEGVREAMEGKYIRYIDNAFVKLKKSLVTYIAENNFACATIIAGVGGYFIHSLYYIPWVFGIGQSIIASYCFYVMLEYLPQKK